MKYTQLYFQITSIDTVISLDGACTSHEETVRSCLDWSNDKEKEETTVAYCNAFLTIKS